MSLYCPKCWAKAKCIDSRCNPKTNHVRRRHECQYDQCGHKFTTVEIIVGAVDLREQAACSSLLDIAWEIFDQLGGDQAERQFFDEWVEKQNEKIGAKKLAGKTANAANKKQASSHPWRLVRSMPGG